MAAIPISMPPLKTTGNLKPSSPNPVVPGANWQGTSGTTKWNPATPGIPKRG